MTTIPLLDMARWYQGDAAERAALAGELDAHLQRLGFLVVVNHEIPVTVTEGLRALAYEFFHLPADVKAPLAVTPERYRGWVGQGLESNAATYGVDTPPDLKETYAWGPVDVPDEALRSRPSYAPNVFPTEPAGFAAAAEAWWRAARALSDDLLELSAMALGLPVDHLLSQCRATTSQVALNWYGPRGELVPAAGQFRIGPHTDFGLYTILDRQPGAGGLQVLDEAGEWIDAPFVPGSFTVNTGDLLRRWTNDRWSSNTHRVLPPQDTAPDEELLSLVFFHEPDDDALIEALPTCVTEGADPRYPPVRAHDYLLEKMTALVVAEP